MLRTMDAAVTTVLFDLDETLCEYARSSTERLADAFERADVDPFFTYDEYRQRVADVGGTESDIRRRERCFTELAQENGRDRRAGLRVADAYEALTDYTSMEFVPGAVALLNRYDDAYRLGLVTNGGPDTQSPKIDALGLRQWFDTVILAGYETPAKPHPEPFTRAIEELDATRDETIYVGNSLPSDIAGANAAGIRSVWKPHRESLDATPDDGGTDSSGPTSAVTPTYRIAALDELVNPPWRHTAP